MESGGGFKLDEASVVGVVRGHLWSCVTVATASSILLYHNWFLAAGMIGATVAFFVVTFG